MNKQWHRLGDSSIKTSDGLIIVVSALKGIATNEAAIAECDRLFTLQAKAALADEMAEAKRTLYVTFGEEDAIESDEWLARYDALSSQSVAEGPTR